MQPEHLSNALAAATRTLGEETSIWQDVIERFRHKTRLQADAMAELVGNVVNSDDVMWGLGQVQVRSFGPPGEPYLMPGIDLCNHSPNAGSALIPERVHRGRLEMCVSSMWNHAPKALAAGDEVCISYDHMPLLPIPQMAGMQRGAAFLVRGFVPSEYLPARRCEPK
ncbi:TPA: hypothetical protein ACH3X3_013515 [Trebouxia sp. C0006]